MTRKGIFVFFIMFCCYEQYNNLIVNMILADNVTSVMMYSNGWYNT